MLWSLQALPCLFRAVIPCGSYASLFGLSEHTQNVIYGLRLLSGQSCLSPEIMEQGQPFDLKGGGERGNYEKSL